MSRLLPVEEALEQILATALSVTDTVELPLIESLGHVLASDYHSAINVPGADNSAMDGYAIRIADLSPDPLPLSQRIPAGSVAQRLTPGTAARIFTGANVPLGADAVVMQEDCTAGDECVVINTRPKPGEHIRPAGQDIATGSRVLQSGRVLRPQDLGLLASIGCASVTVHRPLRVAILSTGDELVEPGSGSLAEGQLYNSNRYTLAGLLRSMNMEVVDCGIVPDDAQATADALQDAAAKADCVITSGGVSVGEEDHVKQQVENLGQLELWKLAIKPGKPLAFGRIGDTPFLGLPGNPSSVFVTFSLIAKPFLRKLQGVQEAALPPLMARAGFTVDRAGGRQEYLRVTLSNSDDGLLANRFSNQSSGVLSSVSHSNALAVIPVGKTVALGDFVEVQLLDLLTA
ncbi:MAG: gephyrin-like molybdotransferase Glp [Halioglobus sp.]